MKILVLNCGSSSIKYALYNMDDKSVMTSGGAERVGLDGAFVKVKLANGEKKQIMHDIPEHTEGVKFIFSLLTDPEIGVIRYGLPSDHASQGLYVCHPLRAL